MMSNDARSTTFPRVGIIGLGTMGLPMASNILRAARDAGSCVTVTARRMERVAGIVQDGAHWVSTAREVATASDVVLLMLPDLPDVEKVLDGDDGLIAGVTAPLVLAIGSTSSPDGVRELATRLASETDGLVSVIDAPVSGGEDGAIAGTLSIMVGGAEADFDRASLVLSAAGVPKLLGPVGSGEVAKACNQMIVAATVLALGEAIVIADRSGLDIGELLGILAGGYAGSRVLETRGDRFVNKDYHPSGMAKYMVKDLSFALAEAGKSGTVAPQLETLFRQFSALVDAGFGEQDISVTRAFVESQVER